MIFYSKLLVPVCTLYVIKRSKCKVLPNLIVTQFLSLANYRISLLESLELDHHTQYESSNLPASLLQ